MIAEIKNLSVRFSTGSAKLQALDDVSFTIEQGARIGFVGESGSGKSTLANAVGRLLPSSATIEATTFRIDGQPVAQLSSAALRDLRRNAIAYIFQDPMAALDPTMAISGQMRLIQKEDDVSLAARLEGVGIRDPRQ